MDKSCINSPIFLLSDYLIKTIANHASNEFLYVELLIERFSLVALRYQPTLNPISRIYAVYESTISTIHHYYGHNSSYLTLYWTNRLLTTKQTKNKTTLISIRPISSQNFRFSNISSDIWTDTE